MCVSPYIVTLKDGSLVPVPCGHCYQCLKQWAKDWRFRLNVERRDCFFSCFLTLTYNDEHLPVAYNDEAGEWQSYVTKKELQDFFKRVRFHVPDLKFRYFAVGEYGGQYNRAHYHVLFNIFNTAGLSFRELYRLFLYCWQGRGFIYLKPTENRHINYVSAYFNKVDKSPHIVKPFKLMSKSIGLSFLTNTMVEYFYRTLRPAMPNPFGKGWVKLPRYYRKKLDEFSGQDGLLWSDLLKQQVFKPRGIDEHFDWFCNNFDKAWQDTYRKELRLQRLHGYHDFPDFDNVNVVFKLWAKDIPDLINARVTDARNFDDALVKHRYTKLNEITYLYRDNSS